MTLSKSLGISAPPFPHLKAWLAPTFVASVAETVMVTVYIPRLHPPSLALQPPALCLTEEGWEVQRQNHLLGGIHLSRGRAGVHTWTRLVLHGVRLKALCPDVVSLPGPLGSVSMDLCNRVEHTRWSTEQAFISLGSGHAGKASGWVSCQTFLPGLQTTCTSPSWSVLCDPPRHLVVYPDTIVSVVSSARC